MQLQTEIPGVEASRETRLYDRDNVQTTSLNNGIRVVSVETGSATTSLAIAVQSGSRYETPAEVGVSHYLRRVAFKSAGDHSVVHMARMPELLGGNMWVNAGRETLVYRAQSLQDNAEEIMHLLSCAVAKPAFHHWEIRDAGALVADDRDGAYLEAETEVMDAVHSSAYRNTLRNSLFCPSHRIGEIDDYMVRAFWQRMYIGPRVVVAGVGIPHSDLVSFAKAGLEDLPKIDLKTEVAQFTTSAAELRMENSNPSVCAALVSSGASISGSEKDLLAAGVLQYLLGSGNHVQYGSSGSRLSQAIKKLGIPAEAEAINLNYTDSGLFGVFAKTGSGAVGKVLKCLVEEISKCTKGIKADELSRAKALLMGHLVRQAESQESLVEDLAVQVLTKGKYVSGSAMQKSIDSVMAADVERLAQNLLTSKHVLVQHGNLSHAPYLDQLR